jgi:hypothetical protein
MVAFLIDKFELNLDFSDNSNEWIIETTLDKDLPEFYINLLQEINLSQEDVQDLQ